MRLTAKIELTGLGARRVAGVFAGGRAGGSDVRMYVNASCSTELTKLERNAMPEGPVQP